MSLTLRPLGNGLYALDTPLMRSNSAVSDRSWVAEITGPDKRYVLARRFLKREKDQVRPTVDGEQTFGPLSEGPVYEYREIAGESQSGYNYRRSGGYSGFFRIVQGELVDLEKAEVLAQFAETSSLPPAPPAERRVIRKWMTDRCHNGNPEDCSMDVATEYALPDGSTTIEFVCCH